MIKKINPVLWLTRIRYSGFFPRSAGMICILASLFPADNIAAQNNSPGNPPLSQRAIEQIERNMVNTFDWDRLNRLKMLNSNFPSIALQQQINAIYEQYRFTLTGLEFEQEKQQIQVQQQNRQQMEKSGHQPPPAQEEIEAAQQRQLQGKPLEMIPQMKIHKEMTDLLNESHYLNAVTNEQAYYNSEYFKKDLSNYIKAKEIINEMLNGKQTLSIKDAFYFSEAAFGNLHLDYQEYNNTIKANTDFIKQWLKDNGYNLTDPEALHYGIQKFMSDTLYISIDEKRRGHIPYYYDYIDALSNKDRRNYFVTKTIATGSGQCHTFPITYLILAEALEVEANLAYNPMHSFIRFKNNKGTVSNYETTVDKFLPNAFYIETLPVMAEAQRNDLYVTELNKKQVVASVLFDLAVNFTQEHWLSDKTFIKECMNIATPYFPNYSFISTAYNYLQKRLYADVLNSKVKEKGIKDLKEIEKYPDVLQAYKNYYGYMESISKLGIQDFPESEYLKLLEYYDYKGKLQTAKKITAKTKRSLFIN